MSISAVTVNSNRPIAPRAPTTAVVAQPDSDGDHDNSAPAVAAPGPSNNASGHTVGAIINLSA